ncbi:hypothetical protein Leryth_015984 [Lithospermum erythrorhizon]|nr:hypothetical protein Leryth_015984 [Lithospermum erythrorhizon]
MSDIDARSIELGIDMITSFSDSSVSKSSEIPSSSPAVPGRTHCKLLSMGEQPCGWNYCFNG